MKNDFEKFAKATMKADSLILSRKDDIYYISDNFMVVRVPEPIYRINFQPISGIFVTLENGESYTKHGTDIMPRKQEKPIDFDRFFAPCPGASVSAFSVDITYKRNARSCRLISTCDGIAVVDNRKLDLITPFAPGSAYSPGKTQRVAWMNADSVTAAAIMPVRENVAEKLRELLSCEMSPSCK